MVKNNEWINFDVSMIEPAISDIDVDDKHVFIGTDMGLVVKDK